MGWYGDTAGCTPHFCVKGGEVLCYEINVRVLHEECEFRRLLYGWEAVHAEGNVPFSVAVAGWRSGGKQA